MSNCPSITLCPFFNDKMKEMPAMANMLKKKYCLSNHVDCARWLVSSKFGRAGVPDNLHPGQNDRARALIGD